MLYFSVLWMLKYSIGWRPSIWGGQIVSAIAEAVFFLCTNWGCFAWIEVVLHRLRLFCTDWGCPAQIEVAPHRLRLLRTDWGCPAPILIEFESMKLFCCERRNSGLEGYMLKHFWEVLKREDQVGTWINTKSISTVWRISEVKKWLISEYGIGCPWPTPG